MKPPSVRTAAPSEIAQIGELIEDMEAACRRGDVEGFRRLAGDFHQLVYRASHNNRLLQASQSVLDHVRQIQTSTFYAKGRPLQALEEHRELLKAIAARDSDSAEILARQHGRKTLELRKKMLREQLRERRAEGDDRLRKREAR